MSLVVTEQESSRAFLTTAQGESFYNDYGDSSLNDAILKVTITETKKDHNKETALLDLYYKENFIDLNFLQWSDPDPQGHWNISGETAMTLRQNIIIQKDNQIDLSTAMLVYYFQAGDKVAVRANSERDWDYSGLSGGMKIAISTNLVYNPNKGGEPFYVFNTTILALSGVFRNGDKPQVKLHASVPKTASYSTYNAIFTEDIKPEQPSTQDQLLPVTKVLISLLRSRLGIDTNQNSAPALYTELAEYANRTGVFQLVQDQLENFITQTSSNQKITTSSLQSSLGGIIKGGFSWLFRNGVKLFKGIKNIIF